MTVLQKHCTLQPNVPQPHDIGNKVLCQHSTSSPYTLAHGSAAKLKPRLIKSTHLTPHALHGNQQGHSTHTNTGRHTYMYEATHHKGPEHQPLTPFACHPCMASVPAKHSDSALWWGASAHMHKVANNARVESKQAYQQCCTARAGLLHNSTNTCYYHSQLVYLKVNSCPHLTNVQLATQHAHTQCTHAPPLPDATGYPQTMLPRVTTATQYQLYVCSACV